MTSIIYEAVKELEKKKKGKPFSAVELRKEFEKRYEWSGEYTTERELIEQLVQPLSQNYMKLDPYVIRNMTSIIAYRYYMFIVANFDYHVCFSATEGKSKSTLALHVVSNLKQLGLNFKWDSHLFFRGTPTQIAVKAINYEKNSVLWFDEAKAYLEKRESMTPERIKLLQDITAQRKNTNVSIYNIGEWTEMDVYMRERRLKEVVILPDKGMFVPLFNTSILGMGKDRFFLNYFERVVESEGLALDYDAQINVLLRLPSNLGIGVFPPITGEVWEEYLRRKELSNTRFLSSKRATGALSEALSNKQSTLSKF